MQLDYRVISIGAMAAHPLWHEKGEVRTGHATTTLVTRDDMRLLVDPSLPAQALVARLNERAGLTHEEITHVFLTSFEPERRRALRAFENATWLMFEREFETAAAAIDVACEQAASADDDELLTMLNHEKQLLRRCRVADDSIASGVDLFPLPGVTRGTCGLLLALPAHTILICGDAVPTWEHLAEGQVLTACADYELAQESFKEAVEIADVLILGRDNMVLNPVRSMMG